MKTLPLVVLACALGACGENGGGGFVDAPGTEGRRKSSPEVRAARRAFDGAPPVIPHAPMAAGGAPGAGAAGCVGCHDERGIEVPGLGFAPAMPHRATDGLSDQSRCTQCHVFRVTLEEFVASDFVAYRGDGQPAHRQFENAPPVIPHRVFMREDCLACHSGPAAREEIRTTHPERGHCTQCHARSSTTELFVR